LAGPWPRPRPRPPSLSLSVAPLARLDCQPVLRLDQCLCHYTNTHTCVYIHIPRHLSSLYTTLSTDFPSSPPPFRFLSAFLRRISLVNWKILFFVSFLEVFLIRLLWYLAKVMLYLRDILYGYTLVILLMDYFRLTEKTYFSSLSQCRLHFDKVKRLSFKNIFWISKV